MYPRTVKKRRRDKKIKPKEFPNKKQKIGVYPTPIYADIFPSDIWEIIFSYLFPHERYTLAQTCKWLYKFFYEKILSKETLLHQRNLLIQFLTKMSGMCPPLKFIEETLIYSDEEIFIICIKNFIDDQKKKNADYNLFKLFLSLPKQFQKEKTVKKYFYGNIQLFNKAISFIERRKEMYLGMFKSNHDYSSEEEESSEEESSEEESDEDNYFKSKRKKNRKTEKLFIKYFGIEYTEKKLCERVKEFIQNPLRISLDK